MENFVDIDNLRVLEHETGDTRIYCFPMTLQVDIVFVSSMKHEIGEYRYQKPLILYCQTAAQFSYDSLAKYENKGFTEVIQLSRKNLLRDIDYLQNFSQYELSGRISSEKVLNEIEFKEKLQLYENVNSILNTSHDIVLAIPYTSSMYEQMRKDLKTMVIMGSGTSRIDKKDITSSYLFGDLELTYGRNLDKSMLTDEDYKEAAERINKYKTVYTVLDIRNGVECILLRNILKFVKNRRSFRILQQPQGGFDELGKL